MSGQVTWEVAVFMIGSMIGGIGLAFVIWRHITLYIDQQVGPLREQGHELGLRHLALREDFASEKLASMDRYASVSHIREVEDRLVKSTDRIVDEMRDIREMLTKALASNAIDRKENRANARRGAGHAP